MNIFHIEFKGINSIYPGPHYGGYSHTSRRSYKVQDLTMTSLDEKKTIENYNTKRDKIKVHKDKNKKEANKKNKKKAPNC